MLKITNLKAGYGENEILHDVDLEVKSDEIVAIIGPNGSGKSTILKSIFKIAQVIDGKITFKGKNLNKLKTYELISEGISFVPQGRQVFNDLTVKENLEMGAFIFKDKEIIKESIKDVFSKFPVLKEKQNEYGFTLSGGQQQILAIARALMQNPQLLLLDEPSLGLSPKATKEIFDIIKKLNKEDISILIVEQNAKKAVEIANKTYVLEDGKIALRGGKEILVNKKIKDIYFG
ncbi:MAG: ABC transporter ATP-binding protein [Candidatus Pacearchaeota archaeon]|jgi:branched-chain amino acid transport system ATP-binding protein